MEKGNRHLVLGRYLLLGIQPDDTPSIIENGAIVVDHGRLEEIGDASDLMRRNPGVPVLGSQYDLVMPGLINAHHHTGLTPLQHGTPFLPLELWLPRFMGWRALDPYLDTLYSAVEMIESGVTTVQHIHGGPAGLREKWADAPTAIMRAYRTLGMRASFSFMWRDRNRVVYGPDEKFLDTLPAGLRAPLAEILAARSASIEALKEHFEFCFDAWGSPSDGMTCVQLAPANLHWCTDNSLKVQQRLAEKHRVGLHMHLLETPYQKAYAEKETGGSAIRHLADLGLLQDGMTLGHGTWASESDIELLRQTRTCLCHNASSGLRLRSGIAPVAEFLQAGLRVAIGIDQAGINDDRDMLQEMRVAWNLQRTPGHDYDPPSAARIFKMASEDGAYTTGFKGKIGTLKVGNAADIVVVDWAQLSRPYLDEEADIVEALIQRAKSSMIKHVMINGRIVMKDRTLLTIDKARLMSEIEACLQVPLSAADQAKRKFVRELDPYIRDFYRSWNLPGASTGYRSWNAKT